MHGDVLVPAFLAVSQLSAPRGTLLVEDTHSGRIDGIKVVWSLHVSVPPDGENSIKGKVRNVRNWLLWLEWPKLEAAVFDHIVVFWQRQDLDNFLLRRGPLES